MVEALFDIYKIKYETSYEAYPWAVVSAGDATKAESLLEKHLTEIGKSALGFKVISIKDTGAKCNKESVFYPIKD